MFETYYWFNKPGETIVMCVSCANDRSDNPNEEYNFETTWPTDPLYCEDCGKEI